jgi:ATP/maltotriose-dependent transcriptional regulator MalT
MEEVLSHQPQDIQDFLLQTSILENLNGSLCDAVIGMRNQKLAVEGRSSQEILEYLERENLFLVSLDSDRLWYRYHHLFADLLRARLEQHDPQGVPTLHLRASEWHEQNQRHSEAVDYALNARDYDRACILRSKTTLKNRRQAVATVANWNGQVFYPLVFKPGDRIWNCTKIIWEAYHRLGLDLDSGRDLWIVPDNLYQSPLVTIVAEDGDFVSRGMGV